MLSVDRINYTIPFKGRIVDAHVHIGNWMSNSGIRDCTLDVDRFTKQPLYNGDTVEKVVVSNLDCMQQKPESPNIEFLSDEIKGNEALLDYANDNPKVVPLATCQPGYGSVDNIKTLFENHKGKFHGLKFHPLCLKIKADDEVYDPYMDFADEHKLPCLFHSGQSYDFTYPSGFVEKPCEFSKPQLIYNLAKRHKDTPVIMAHMGGKDMKNSQEAVDCIISSIRNKDANLYADFSWVDCENAEKPCIIKAIERLKEEPDGLDRIIFGTDAPLGRFGDRGENGIPPYFAYTSAVEDTKNAIKKSFGSESDEIIDKVFYKNAMKVYSIKEEPQNDLIDGIKSWFKRPFKD